MQDTKDDTSKLKRKLKKLIKEKKELINAVKMFEN